MHYTGYRHVIGTLWSVYDQTAADVAEAVYHELTSTGQFEPGRSANALHDAIRGLRDSTGRLPGVLADWDSKRRASESLSQCGPRRNELGGRASCLSGLPQRGNHAQP